MKYFTSDWHLGDDRIGVNGKPNLFYRPFDSVKKQDDTIVSNFIFSGFQDGDELYHLGDVLFDIDKEVYLSRLRSSFPNSKFILIEGNYDEGKSAILGKYFDEIWQDGQIKIGGTEVYLNHYPSCCKNTLATIAITGHIHGLWKVQKNMINVGVDAWHFQPIPEETIQFCMNAILHYYDENVFPYA